MFDSIVGNIQTVLDLGCGPATMRAVLPTHVEYFGVDFAPSIIRELGDPSHFEVADFNVDPTCFGTKKFDVLICSGIFEYIREPLRFIAFLASKVSDEGHLILSYTNRQHFRSIPAMLRGERPTYVDPHHNFTSIPQAMEMLSAHRFQLISYTGITHRRKWILPLFSRFTRFPLSLFNRQFVFMYRHVKGASSPVLREAELPSMAATGSSHS
jgi:SAM-dependent methyltransferase